MRRRNRPFVAWLAIVALLFAQLATAAYACPQITERAPAPVAMTDCDHEREASPNLCQRHCDYGNASLDTGKPLVAPDAIAPLPQPLVLAVPRVRETCSLARHAAATGPPSTRLTVLRI